MDSSVRIIIKMSAIYRGRVSLSGRSWKRGRTKGFYDISILSQSEVAEAGSFQVFAIVGERESLPRRESLLKSFNEI